jgi:nicotinamidase/pyrazinamidase
MEYKSVRSTHYITSSKHSMKPINYWENIPATTALLQVDAQNAFTPSGGLPVPEGADIVPAVNRILDWASKNAVRVIATVDQHPLGHVSFASAWGQASFTQNPLDLTNPSNLLWPDHSVGETRDTEFIAGIVVPKGLDITPIYKWYAKERDAYSGFDMGVTALTGTAKDGYEIARWAKTLMQVLEEAQIQTLRIYGLVTEVCVTDNAKDALKNGFDVEIVAPACRGLSPDGHIAALERLRALDGIPNRQGRIQKVTIIETLP